MLIKNIGTKKMHFAWILKLQDKFLTFVKVFRVKTK